MRVIGKRASIHAASVLKPELSRGSGRLGVMLMMWRRATEASR
jgi:hypothetical protein